MVLLVWAFFLILFFTVLTKIFEYFVLRKVYWFRNDLGNRMRGTHPRFIFGDLLSDVLISRPLEDKPFLRFGNVYYQWFFWRPTVVIVDRNTIQHVLIDNATNYQLNASRPQGNLLTVNNNQFQRQKRLISSAFSKSNLKLLCGTLDIYVDTILSDLLLNSQGQGMVKDAYTTFLQYTRDLMGQIVFGNSSEALTIIQAQRAISENNKLSFLRYIMPHLAYLFPSFFGVDKILKGRGHLDKLLSNPQDGTLLSFISKSSSSQGESLHISEIKSNLFAFGIAGIDSVASALSCLMFVLVSYPDVQTKIREEIQQVFGTIRLVGQEYKKYKQLTYLTMVIKETLRLYPPFPILPPRSARRHDKLGGYHIPSHTSVVINVVGYNRNPSYWQNPDEFNPLRFQHPQEHKKHFMKDSSLAWGAGPRQCVGKKIGMMILRATLVSILCKYSVESPNAKVDNVQIGRSFGTLKPYPGLSIQLVGVNE